MREKNLKKEKLRQEQEFESQSKVVEFKRNLKAKREIMIREVVFHPSTLPSMKTQFPKGVIPSLISSSHIFYQYLLHGLSDFIEIMFDDYFKYIFDLGGTKLQLLWALKNPFYLRTDALQ